MLSAQEKSKCKPYITEKLLNTGLSWDLHQGLQTYALKL